MFTYINENFLHAPSTDLSRETVKTLIQVMLAQGQEVFLEKQIADGKKVGLLAKLASQAGYLYAQAVEGTQENVNKAIFEKVWLLVVQVWNPSLFFGRGVMQDVATEAHYDGVFFRYFQPQDYIANTDIDQIKLHEFFGAILPSLS